jgi:hypothetical protein
VAKYIAPEEEWMRMLTLELTPVLNVMRGDDLPPGKPSRSLIHLPLS